jgi:uncharacterized membrane protein
MKTFFIALAKFVGLIVLFLASTLTLAGALSGEIWAHQLPH